MKIKDSKNIIINQVVEELSVRNLCSRETKLENFDEYCHWLTDLTNSHGSDRRVEYAFALDAINEWIKGIRVVEYQLEAQEVLYHFIKCTIDIFTRK
jgi:hypothetical protein